MKTREVVSIHTEHPLSEIWSNLIFFESEYNSETFLKKRIKGDFYGLDYKTLNVLKTKSGVKLDVFRTIEPRDVKDNAIELAYCFKLSSIICMQLSKIERLLSRFITF